MTGACLYSVRVRVRVRVLYHDRCLPALSSHQTPLTAAYLYRSFVIRNTSASPLPFFLNSDLKPDKSKSELFFSLSSNSVRKFKSIVIEPGSHQRIYVFYRPHPNAADVFLTKTHQTGKERPAEGSIINETINIYVNCRIVKVFSAS